MQIIEVTEFTGVRSAVFTFRHRTSPLRFVVFPMIHVGEASFYAEVESRLRQVDLVLAEGIDGDSRAVRAITSSYRWAARSGRLDLVVQHLDHAGLGVPVLRADITADEFAAAWRDVPLRQTIQMEVLAPLAGLGIGLFGTRRWLAGLLGMDDLPSADDLLASEGLEDVEEVVVHTRDRRLVAHVEAAHDQLGDLAATVAIVYGAGHVPAVVRALRRLGYHPCDSEWLTVFRLDAPDASDPAT